MKQKIKTYFQRLTFRRQLSIAVTCGIFILALCISVAGSWQANNRARYDLIEQGQRVTESLANQYAFALVYGSAEYSTEAVRITATFPGVIGIEIRDAHGHSLLTQGKLNRAEFLEHAEQGSPLQSAALLSAESNNAWHFIAPVYSPPARGAVIDEAAAPVLLGHVSVIISKEALTRMTANIFIANLVITLTLALWFLFLIRRLTDSMMRPLIQLSDIMGRAQKGETRLRVEPSGPSDIASMASAFNNMMTVLNEREAALSVAAIAFESNGGMMVTDENSKILRVNQGFTRVTGFSAEEAIGNKPSMLKSGRQNNEFYQHMWACLHRDHHWQGEIFNRRKNGEIYPEWLSISAVIDKDEKVTNYLGAFLDITESKNAENEIYNLAFFDPLCHLPNRRLLLDRLRIAAATSVRNKTGCALMFIDMDNFKIVNDTKGHGEGDLLLIEVSTRLQACVRKGDTLARFGGDEFVLLLEDLSEDKEVAAVHARGIGEKVLEVLHRPYVLGKSESHISASIGITLFFNYRGDLDELLKQADTAMYEAKKSGRNTLRFFDPVMQEKLEIRALLEAGMHEALIQNQFQLYYQMQVSNVGKVVGAEVLVRWIHPERGVITPKEFIPVAEDTGFILPLGQWVLDSACHQIKEWESLPQARDLQLAVNVSARQFHQIGFVKQVIDVINQTGINPSRLKLELTESIVIDDVADTIAKMQALRKLGVIFSMDDFGTGYSSLAYLTKLPLSQLKIDQSFVNNIGNKAADATIIQTIIGMAVNLGMEVIAEGVETKAQFDFLEHAGCKLYQGFLFGKPVPVDEFEQKLQHIS